MYVHHSEIIVTCCLKEWCVSPDELSQDVHQDGGLVVCYSSETGVLGSASKQDVAVLCTCVLQKHHSYIDAARHMHICTYVHKYIHTYIHTYIRTYILHAFSVYTGLYFYTKLNNPYHP